MQHWLGAAYCYRRLYVAWSLSACFCVYLCLLIISGLVPLMAGSGRNCVQVLFDSGAWRRGYYPHSGLVIFTSDRHTPWTTVSPPDVTLTARHVSSTDCSGEDSAIEMWRDREGRVILCQFDCVTIRTQPLICRRDDAYPSRGRGCGSVLHAVQGGATVSWP